MDVAKVKEWLALFTTKINEEKAYLSELDSAIGDGDHGMNMARGTTEMMVALKEKNPETVVEVFKLAGMTLVSKVGGASGPLYGSAFISMAKAAMSSEELVTILNAGLAGIQKRGKAEVGEKTMVDMWAGVIGALENDQLTADVLVDISEQTKDKIATKGRASYLGERSIGHLDPGTVSSRYLFETMLEAGVNS
ncbi:dihydroxyacetone kinase subunit L [Vagococcus sp. BWB3-3]|uniref:phosphoenolpyruvate--glycerone phosphotransferase n=1 Tax=Vagococcus allomyrinae TaxID=2794353 RepID=A0A940PBN8_9ENTE|nr:dihydroxyacetone kinase subunit DhaL [Vagococcus allomyrinae]MBP1039758.1 dihydroxyacetone kinase subunit L [Vagococcus allomyrinae]